MDIDKLVLKFIQRGAKVAVREGKQSVTPPPLGCSPGNGGGFPVDRLKGGAPGETRYQVERQAGESAGLGTGD